MEKKTNEFTAEEKARLKCPNDVCCFTNKARYKQ